MLRSSCLTRSSVTSRGVPTGKEICTSISPRATLGISSDPSWGINSPATTTATNAMIRIDTL